MLRPAFLAVFSKCSIVVRVARILSSSLISLSPEETLPRISV